MRNMNPLENTGVLLKKDSSAFLGSCFVFRYPNTLLTARHCISDFKESDLCVVLPCINKMFDVAKIEKHSEADIAILSVPGIKENDITWPQYQIFNDNSWGEDYMALGYPQEYIAGDFKPTPRIFKGHIQRYFNHKSHLGYIYYAAELSAGCPRGLSGGPVFNPGFHGRLFGLVTENLKTTTELETISEVEENGVVYKEHYHNVINYGVALWLPSVEKWIDNYIPPVPQEEIARWAKNQEKWRKEQQNK